MDAPVLEVAENTEEVWQRIRPGLEVIARKDGHPWTPEDLRPDFDSGNFKIALFPEGFMVWHLQVDEFTQDVTFWAWLMYGEGANVFWQYEEQVCELARTCGANRIGFTTSRKGYPRKLRNTAWQLKRYVFEREL